MRKHIPSVPGFIPAARRPVHPHHAGSLRLMEAKGELLEDLERRNLFVVPLDGQRQDGYNRNLEQWTAIGDALGGRH